MKKSQLGQDVVALTINKFKKKGFFVEFGATNGFDLSNTYLLEKEQEENGIKYSKEWEVSYKYKHISFQQISCKHSRICKFH